MRGMILTFNAGSSSVKFFNWPRAASCRCC